MALLFSKACTVRNKFWSNKVARLRYKSLGVPVARGSYRYHERLNYRKSLPLELGGNSFAVRYSSVCSRSSLALILCLKLHHYMPRRHQYIPRLHLYLPRHIQAALLHTQATCPGQIPTFFTQYMRCTWKAAMFSRGASFTTLNVYFCWLRFNCNRLLRHERST